MADLDKEDAEMFRWLCTLAQQTDYDGGWVGMWDIRGIPAYSGSTYGGAKPFDHRTFRNAVKAAMRAAQPSKGEQQP